jgi:excisionase family DNA binding protein
MNTRDKYDIQARGELFPWTYRDVAVACAVSIRTVCDWTKRKKIPFLKTGRSVRFNPNAVRIALENFVIHPAGSNFNQKGGR